jgi:hypothetical protein
MTDTKARVSFDRQLQGKSNFISWTRDFERAAKAKDVFNLLNGDEKILKEPQEDAYLTDAPRASRTREVVQLAIPGGETSTLDNLAHAIMKWQADHKRWENNRVTVRKAKNLLNDWVCEGIAIELEEYENPVDAYKYINKRYKVSDDRARGLLLGKVFGTKLGDFASMTEYVNKHRQLKADLKKAKHTCTDSQFVTNVLHGLPDNYRNFKSQYDLGPLNQSR